MLKAILKILRPDKYKTSKECTQTRNSSRLFVKKHITKREDNSTQLEKKIIWFFLIINICDCAIMTWVY